MLLGRSILKRLLLALVVLGPGAQPLLAGDALYYKQVGDELVFTNLESADVKPLPGFASAARTPRGGSVLLPASPYDHFIERLAVEHDLSADLIKAVAQVESGFNPRARSPKGAQGLMQLMPATARQYGVRDSYDPFENLRGGATHLRRLLDQFDGDQTLALAAYNAGAGAVRRFGGVPAYRETRDYVRKVQALLRGGQTVRKRDRAPRVATRVEGRIVYLPDGSISLVN